MPEKHTGINVYISVCVLYDSCRVEDIAADWYQQSDHHREASYTGEYYFRYRIHIFFSKKTAALLPP